MWWWWGGEVRLVLCSAQAYLPRFSYPLYAPHPLSLVQGLKYLELGPAAGAAELVDCAIDLVVVTGVREAAAAEAAGSGRAWGIERKGERKREERESTESVRQCRDGEMEQEIHGKMWLGLRSGSRDYFRRRGEYGMGGEKEGQQGSEKRALHLPVSPACFTL